MANKSGQKQTESNSQKAGKPGFVAVCPNVVFSQPRKY